MEGILKRCKSLPSAVQVSVLKCPSNRIEIQGPIRAQERIIFMENLITQRNQIVVSLLGGTQIARFEGLVQLPHFRSTLAEVLLPES